MRRWMMVTAGWGLMGLGVAGLVLPVVPGILFLALGGAVLAKESPWMRKRLQILKRRYPMAAARFDAVMREKRCANIKTSRNHTPPF